MGTWSHNCLAIRVCCENTSLIKHFLQLDQVRNELISAKLLLTLFILSLSPQLCFQILVKAAEPVLVESVSHRFVVELSVLLQVI